ncbi:MAG: site-specific integrase, partial [Bacteroidetes bacterium]|nr:site-specific integrase [Bacteroidota bacterium]
MKVTIREKKLHNGRKSLYLDIYHKGKRRYEFLNLYLTKNKLQNKETKFLAEKIRTDREIKLQNDSYGFISDSLKQRNFVTYIEN